MMSDEMKTLHDEMKAVAAERDALLALSDDELEAKADELTAVNDKFIALAKKSLARSKGLDEKQVADYEQDLHQQLQGQFFELMNRWRELPDDSLDVADFVSIILEDTDDGSESRAEVIETFLKLAEKLEQTAIDLRAYLENERN